MWTYTDRNAWDTISLHDCRADTVTFDGKDLFLDFPDGFWLTPASPHNQQDAVVKTGPARLCFRGVYAEDAFDAIDLYKTTYLFRKPLLCRRLQPSHTDFLKLFRGGRFELEFITEYHSQFGASVSSLYRCWLWKKNSGLHGECQLEILAKSLEYSWNEIRYERTW
jgi:hypothetical protein